MKDRQSVPGPNQPPEPDQHKERQSIEIEFAEQVAFLKAPVQRIDAALTTDPRWMGLDGLQLGQ